MSVLNSLRHLIYSFDMFCSSQLLRYRSQTQHKTLTGGLLSLVVISVVVGGFANMVGDTLNRVAITSSLVNKKMSNSPMIKLQPGNDNMFMLGFAIRQFENYIPVDLVKGPQYFNIITRNFQFRNGGLTNLTYTKLEQCTREHWKMMPELVASYDNLGVDKWLCLPLGASYVLQGSSYDSAEFAFLIVEVVPCKNSTANNTCAPQQDIDALFAASKNFFLSFSYTNPVINPNQQDFMSYYVEGNDYILFSPDSVGAENWLLFSDYTITTDESILPYSQFTQVTGSVVQQRSISHPYVVDEKIPYAKLILSKSGNSLYYDRQIQKISAVFSYIGGLVGAITAVLFLVKTYTDTSLEIAIGFSLFELSRQSKQKEDKKQDKGFNPFGYLKLTFYRLMKFFGWKGRLLVAERLEKLQYEAIKQMDVQLLLKRVIKLETCMSKILTPQQLKEIREGQAITFKSARNMRMLLLKEDQQPNPDYQGPQKDEHDKKEFEIKDEIIFNPTSEQMRQKERSQIDSGSSIYKLKVNKYGSFIKPSQSHIEEIKTVTRKAILKKKKEDENGNEQNCNKHLQKNSRKLVPIIL